MKRIIRKWLGIASKVSRNEYEYGVITLNDKIEELDVQGKGRYHGLLHGEGNLIGMLEIQKRLDKLEDKIQEIETNCSCQ